MSIQDDDYQFDGIELLQRNREIEGTIGTEIGIPGGITLRVLAASDANPRWRQRGPEIRAELNRMTNAMASPAKQRAYLSRIYAECIVIGWQGVKNRGVEIPYSADACAAWLRKADDAFRAIERVIYEDTNFRGQRIEAVVAEGKA